MENLSPQQQLQENGSFGQILQHVPNDQPTIFSPSYDCQDLSDDDVEYLDSLNKKFINRQNEFKMKAINDIGGMSTVQQSMNVIKFNNEHSYLKEQSLLGKSQDSLGPETIFLQKVEHDQTANNFNDINKTYQEQKQSVVQQQNLVEFESQDRKFLSPTGIVERRQTDQDSFDQVIQQTPSQIANQIYNNSNEVIKNIFQPTQSQYEKLISQIQQQKQQQPVKKYKLQNVKKSRDNNLQQKSLKWTKQDLIYEKLSQNNKPHYIEVARLIKEIEEKKQCPFKPQVNQEGRRYHDQQELFERLYQEKDLKEDLNNRRELIKQQKETLGCSFTPHRITKKYQSSENYNNPLAQSYNNKQLFEKLYQDHEQIQKNKQIKKQVLEQIEQQGLTFTPTIFTKSRGSHQFQQTHSLSQAEQQKRFEQLYQDSSRRREKILQMQEDKELKLQQNHNSVLKKRSNSVNGPMNQRSQSRENKENISNNQNNENSKPRYIGLYESSLQRKERMRKLEKEVNKERGITFTPQKYTQTINVNSARSLTRSQLSIQNQSNDKPLNIKDLKTSQNTKSKQKLPPKPTMNKNKK